MPFNMLKTMFYVHVVCQFGALFKVNVCCLDLILPEVDVISHSSICLRGILGIDKSSDMCNSLAIIQNMKMKSRVALLHFNLEKNEKE